MKLVQLDPYLNLVFTLLATPCLDQTEQPVFIQLLSLELGCFLHFTHPCILPCYLQGERFEESLINEEWGQSKLLLCYLRSRAKLFVNHLTFRRILPSHCVQAMTNKGKLFRIIKIQLQSTVIRLNTVVFCRIGRIDQN